MSKESAATAALIKGSKLVEDAFGYWPSFHDAEIIGLSINFSKSCNTYGSDVILLIHHWGQDNPTFTGNEPDCIIEIRCRGPLYANIEIQDSGAGGWISEIRVTEDSNGRLLFDITPLSGLDVRINCASVEVIGITPITEQRSS
ncbi:hypothetical protein [Cupriavidus sp. YAF13]|uniref:hypothetical protein n=1 Tax=Cupriavidus sp. YAF13 TaxID=3233075 RepID=UPI003F9392AA